MEAHKHCKRCDVMKPAIEFGPNKARKDGLAVYCRACTKEYMATKNYDADRWAEKRVQESDRNRQYRQANAERIGEKDRAKAADFRLNNPGKKKAYNIARKQGQKNATPPWADMHKINAIYAEARRLTELDGVERHVDHQVPLKHPLVCGLHVEYNLGILTAAENLAKHNQFELA